MFSSNRLTSQKKLYVYIYHTHRKRKNMKNLATDETVVLTVNKRNFLNKINRE